MKRNRSGDNPYTAPKTKDDSRQESVRSASSAGQALSRREKFGRVFQVLSGLVVAFSFFWFSASVYEIAKLKDDTYGPNTWRFRNSYIEAAVTSFVVGAISLAASVWLRRRLRRSR